MAENHLSKNKSIVLNGRTYTDFVLYNSVATVLTELD
jgi:hypothetical protein